MVREYDIFEGDLPPGEHKRCRVWWFLQRKFGQQVALSSLRELYDLGWRMLLLEIEKNLHI